jgi:hypothetical protein
MGDGEKPLCATASSDTRRAICAISRRSRVLRYLIALAASLREGRVYNDRHGSLRSELSWSRVARAYLVGEHKPVPLSINGRGQLALVRRIVQAAVIAVSRQQPRDVGHDERDGTNAFDLGFPGVARVRMRKEGPNARRIIPPSLLLGQRSVAPVAPTPSRKKIPEAEPQRIREAEARPEMSEPSGDFFEWAEEHVPLERVGKGHGG